MTIHYNTYKFPGEFDKRVFIDTGKDGADQSIIKLVGYVNPMPMGVMQMNERKTDLDTLKVGQANKAVIKVYNGGDAPYTVTKVVSKKFKNIYFEGKVTVNPGEKKPIEFEVTPKKAGRFMDILMIHSDARNDIGKGYKAVITGTAE